MGVIRERDVLPAILLRFPIVTRMTLGMNNPLLMPSRQARKVVERKERVFTHGFDPLLIRYFAAAYFHSSEIKFNTLTDGAGMMRVSIPPRFDVRDVNSVLEKAGFEKKDPVYNWLTKLWTLGLEGGTEMQDKEASVALRVGRDGVEA